MNKLIENLDNIVEGKGSIEWVKRGPSVWFGKNKGKPWEIRKASGRWEVMRQGSKGMEYFDVFKTVDEAKKWVEKNHK